jgi:hypothetical protein
MKTFDHNKSINTVTGVFSTKEDAENAYQTLLNLGYMPNEISLIMSEETCRQSFGYAAEDFERNFLLHHRKKLQVTSISDGLDVYGKFVAIPGLALVVIGDLHEGAHRALLSSVLSDDYAEYFQRRLVDGEILIDFGLHTSREKRLILGLWEDYGGFPLVRRISAAA